MGVAERRARLVARHRLGPGSRAKDALSVARSLVVLHATDASTVFLSAQARTEGMTADDMARELYDVRSLVRILAMRRTLFVVPREQLPVVFAAASRDVATRERKRLEGNVVASGLSTRPGPWLARASRLALEAVAERGEATTREVVASAPVLAKKLQLAPGTKWAMTQTVGARIVQQLAAEGRLVRARPPGDWTSQNHRWTTPERWLGGPIEQLAPAEARVELVRAWLRSFGPGTLTDIRWWTGWTVRDVKAALAVVQPVEVDLGGSTTGYVLADDLAPTAPPSEPAAALLPVLDATTMGWKERDWYLGPHETTLFDSVGNGGATVWWDGRVVGGWTQRRDGEVVTGLLEKVPAAGQRAIAAEADRLQRWLGEVRIAPGFQPPYQRSLAT